MKRPTREGKSSRSRESAPSAQEQISRFARKLLHQKRQARAGKEFIMVTNLQFLVFVKAILDILATSETLDEARDRVAALFKL